MKNMKKILSLLLVFALALTVCGCGTKEEKPAATPEPTVEPTPEPMPEPTPSWDAGYARSSLVGVVYKMLSRGDDVNVVGAEGDYYCLEHDGDTVFVEKCFVRLDCEEPFTAFAGYGAENDSPVYFSPYMSSAEITSFDRGQEINVLDIFGIWAWVEVNSIEGCTAAENVTDTPPRVYSGGGGGGGGSSGADGGDIALAFENSGAELTKLASYGCESPYIPFPDGHGVILADGVEAYLKILHKGDSYMVTTDLGKIRTVYDGVNSGEVPGWALNMSKDSVFIEWDGFAQNKAEAFDNYRLLGIPTILDRNTPVHVVFDIGTCYLVTVGENEYFMSYDMVSETEVKAYSGGGGGGGSSGGGGGEWSPPVL